MTGASLYDELGVAHDASAEEMRAAYRREARRRHPDVAVASTDEAMRRLNEVWAVLGDPERRRQYDLTLAGPAPLLAPAVDAAPSPPRPLPPRRPLFLRPSVLILAVLAGIFVVTAYAGSPASNHSGPTPATVRAPSTVPGSASVHPIGQCLAGSDAAGDVAIVGCSAPHFGQIIAEAATPSQCPTGTVARPWALRPTVLCTVESAAAP